MPSGVALSAGRARRQGSEARRPADLEPRQDRCRATSLRAHEREQHVLDSVMGVASCDGLADACSNT